MSEREKFPPFEYTVVQDPSSVDKIIFTATGQNDGQSTIVWEGKVTGKSIEGTATWTNMNGPQKEFFKGTLREKK